MSRINLNDYEFDEQLLKNIRLFDEVLSEFGEPPLLENQNFTIHQDQNLSPDYVVTYLIMESTNIVKNSLPISILFEGNDLRIDIDGIPETFVWAKENIDEDRNKAVEFLENLFTGYILIDYRGTTARFVQMFSADGHFIMSFSRNVLLHLFGRYLFRQKDYRRLFLPIFKKVK